MAEKKMPGVSDAAVKKATGKTWEQWFALLDKQKAHELAHKDIAELLNSKYLDSSWWSQTVTVMYERARGLREVHQTADGFVAHVNKTFNVSLDKLYAAWRDGASRADWLATQGIEVTRENVNKSMRMIWSDGVSRVLVNFTPKGKDKAQVSVEHTQLDSAADVKKAKSSWKESLERLQEKLSKYG